MEDMSLKAMEVEDLEVEVVHGVVPMWEGRKVFLRLGSARPMEGKSSIRVGKIFKFCDDGGWLIFKAGLGCRFCGFKEPSDDSEEF
jgi:hypothetical protein